MIRAAAPAWRLLLALAVVVWLVADRSARDVVLVTAAVLVVALTIWGTSTLVRRRYPLEHPEDEEQP